MIKRYVKEMANDIKRDTNGYYDKAIERIFSYLERNMITNLEAAQMLCRLVKEEK